MAEEQKRGDGQSVIDWLQESRVLTIDRNDDGTYSVTEGCDGWFSATLTADELRELASELIALANANRRPDPPHRP